MRGPRGHVDASAVCGDLSIDSSFLWIFLHVFGMSLRKSRLWSYVLHEISKGLCTMTVSATTLAPAIASGTMLPADSLLLSASKFRHKAKHDLPPTHHWEEITPIPW